MAFFPMFYDLEGKVCVFIGGGVVATRKIKVLMDFGPIIRVVSPRISEDLNELWKQGKIDVVLREYQKGDINGSFMVVPTTWNTELNREIYLEAIEQGIHANSADGIKEDAFVFPSIVKRGDIIAAVTSSGDFPLLTAHLRDLIDKAIDPDIEEIAKILKRVRERLKNKDFPQKKKESFMKIAFNTVISSFSETNPILNNRTLLESRLDRLYNDYF